jgi:hypothetical protein
VIYGAISGANYNPIGDYLVSELHIGEFTSTGKSTTKAHIWLSLPSREERKGKLVAQLHTT